MKRVLVLMILVFIFTICDKNYQAYSYTTNYTSAGGQPTKEQIDAGISQAAAQGRIIAIDARGMSVPAALQQVTTLPVTFRSTIGSWHYDITVLSMGLTPTGSVLSIGCRFYIPDSNNGASIYFGSNTIAVSGKSGFSGDLPILESSLSTAKSNELDDPLNKLQGETHFFEFPIPSLNGQAWMGLGKQTKLSFSCGEFKKFTLAGFVKLYGGIERETNAGQALTDGKPLMLFWDKNDVFDWQDIYFPVTVSRGFHATNTRDIGFHFAENTTAILDLSSYQSPSTSPSCSSTTAEAWQGVQFNSFQIRLPSLFKLRNPRALAAEGTNLFWDAGGLTGNIQAASVFSISEGYTDDVNKFGLSLDLLTATYGCNRASTVSMQGKIQLGNCLATGATPTKNLYYNIVYDGLGQRYQTLIKEKETDRFQNNGLALSTGSTVNLSITGEQFLVQTSLPARPRLSTPAYNNSVCLNYPTTLTVDNCGGYHTKWSSGDEHKITITVSPSQNTAYTVNCYDDYCISENTEPLTIQVYKSLPEPTLSAERTSFCAYQQSALRADNCAGKMEWRLPGSADFKEIGVDDRQQTAVYPGQVATGTYTYTIRCNLNTCLSPEKATVLTVYPAPKAPSLSSNAVNNTIDRNGSVNLSGSCATNETLIWDNLAKNTVTLASSATYYAYCKNTASGCETQHKSAITITVLYLPPAAPNPLMITSFNTRSISLQWGDNSDNEDGFWVYRSISSSFSDAVRIADLGRNTTTFTDEGLSEGITYYYRVVSHNRYDNGYSQLVSRSTAITPTAPSLTASSTYIQRGSSVTISGSCAVGTLIWTSPSGFNGGTTTQADHITYSAKCSSNGIDGLDASITVTVFDKPTVVVPTCVVSKPTLSLITASGSASIQTGEKVTINASCATGNLVWEAPANFAGGDSYPRVNTQYRARCVVDQACQSELVMQDIIVQGTTTTPNNPPIATTPPVTIDPPACVVNQPVLSLNGSNASIRKGDKINITATCATGSVMWESPSGFTGGDSSPETDTQYKVYCMVSESCKSELVTQDIIVQGTTTPTPTKNPPPPVTTCGVSKPTISLNSGSASIQKGEKVNITATCATGDLVWTSPSGFTSGDSYPQVNTSYRALCVVDSSCKSEPVVQDIIVRVTPPPTTEPNPIFSLSASQPTCKDGSLSDAMLHLTHIQHADRYAIWPGNSYQGSNDCNQAKPFSGIWVDIPCVSPASGNQQAYTVRIWKSGNCVQWYDQTITITSPECQRETPCTTPDPVIEGPDYVEKGALFSLLAVGCDDCEIEWSTYTPWMWKPLVSVPRLPWNAIVTSIDADYTFQVRFKSNNCWSSWRSKTVRIKQTPTPVPTPTVPTISQSGMTVCENSSLGVTLTAANCNGSLSWNTGETSSSITIYKAGTYTVLCSLGGKTQSSEVQIASKVPPVIQISQPFPTRLQVNSIDGCTGGIRWTRTANGESITITSYNPSYIDIPSGAYGRYEATCSTDCGSSSTTYYVRP